MRLLPAALLLAFGALYACVYAVRHDSARPWLEVRTQPLELSAGELTAEAPLLQQLRGPARGATERLEALEIVGRWIGTPDPASVTLRVRTAASPLPLAEARGSAGSSASRVRFSLPALDLQAEQSYALEFALSPGAWNSQFAPLLRPRARLGKRVRGAVASEPLQQLDLLVTSTSDELCGIAVPLARTLGGWAKWTLRAEGAAETLAAGRFELAPARGATLPCGFGALDASRGRRFELRIDFEREARLWIGPAGPAHQALHGRPRPDGRLEGVSRFAAPIPDSDLVLSLYGFSEKRAPSGREWAGLCALAAAAAAALCCCTARRQG